MEKYILSVLSIALVRLSKVKMSWQLFHSKQTKTHRVSHIYVKLMTTRESNVLEASTDSSWSFGMWAKTERLLLLSETEPQQLLPHQHPKQRPHQNRWIRAATNGCGWQHDCCCYSRWYIVFIGAWSSTLFKRMDKKATYCINHHRGCFDSVLLIIGVRIVQRRSSQASEPTSFSAQRTDADSCKITAIIKSDEGILVRYGAAHQLFLSFFTRKCCSTRRWKLYPRGNHWSLSESRVTFVVEGHENITAAQIHFQDQQVQQTRRVAMTWFLPTSAPTEEPTAGSSNTWTNSRAGKRARSA